MPDKFIVNDNMIEMPASEADADKVEVIYGPNINRSQKPKNYRRALKLKHFSKSEMI